MQIEVPEEALRELRMTLDELDQEVRLMLAARLCERGLVSTGKAAELAGVPRTLLLAGLCSFGVSIAEPGAAP